METNKYIVELKNNNPDYTWENIADILFAEDMTVELLSPNAVRKRYRREVLREDDEDSPKVSKSEEKEVDYDTEIKKARLKLLNLQSQKYEQEDTVQTAKKDNLIAVVQDALTPIEYQPLDKDESKIEFSGDEEAAVLILSDTHFGKKTKHYNMNVGIERFTKIIDNFIKVVRLHRKAYPIKKAYILWTGDIVDGDNIYPTHAHHVDNHVVNQIFKSLEHVVPQISRLADEFEEVNMSIVRGNHGRISKHAHENANFDLLYGYALKSACTNMPNVKCNVVEDWQTIVDVFGTKILQYHGHQIKMTLNLPFYGVTTRISRWAATQSLANFDVAVQGHFHSSCCMRWNDKLVFLNGTTVAQDQFALEFIGLESSECQWCFGVHPTRKVTWRYELTPN